MALSIEKRLAALESRSTDYNVVVRFVVGDTPAPEEEAEHAEIKASGAHLIVVQFIPTASDLAARAATC
jgi:hypothetical protein